MHQILRKKQLKTRCFQKLSEYWTLNTGYWALGTGFCLTGCMGVYEGSFECPPGKGLGCQSISEVNEQYSVSSVQCSEGKMIPPEIWYSPIFQEAQKEKARTRLDASNSI